MPTIRIVSWSIENLGPLRSGLMYGNTDIIQGIASSVSSLNADIFVLLDVSSTKDGTAAQVSGAMAAALQAESVKGGKTGEFETWVLSSNIGSEYFAFFIRDVSLTVPIPVTGTKLKPTDPPKILGGDGTAITDAIFTESNAKGVLPHAFPYLSPDIALQGSDGTTGEVPKWNGNRRPALGLFAIPSASSSNQLLPIVACRLSDNPSLAVGQIRTFPNVSLLKFLGPSPAAPALAFTPIDLQIVSLGGQSASSKSTSYFAIAGNFNVDYMVEPEFYAPITTNLGATAGTDAKTLLVTIDAFDPGAYKTTESLAIRAYDNVFVRSSATSSSPVVGQNPQKTDIPGLISNRTLPLNSSVRYYAELDTVGVPAPETYACLMNSFGRALAADPPENLSVQNSLIGARLVADHLPISLDLVID